MAIEENYWAEAMANDAVDSFLPSGLVPNQKLVLDKFQHVPTSIAFQSTAFPAIVYNKARAPFIKTLKDLADPRLKGKVTLPAPGDITAGGFLLGLAAELGKDYKDPAQMKEVVDWAVANIGPNVVKYTTDSSEMQQLLRSGAVDAGRLLEQPRPSRVSSAATRTPPCWFPPTDLPGQRLPVDPEGRAAPGAGPDLHQLAARQGRPVPERLADRARPVERAQRGLPRSGLRRTRCPDWFKADYSKYYPTLDQIKSNFKAVDWTPTTQASKEWQDYYAQKNRPVTDRPAVAPLGGPRS